MKIKRELREWIILIIVGGFIYLMGWHTAIIGKIQQLVLATGIISPTLVEEEKLVSFDFTLENLEGEVVSFTDFEGKTVFLNFWATWCPPCIAEMPDIHSLYEEKGSDVAFAMISLDENKEKAKAFISRKDFKFPVYFLRSALPAGYNIHSIPTTYLIDKDHKVRVENHGMAKYNTSSFKELLEEIQ